MGTPGAYVHAYHLILTGYGFWLPNDPRGSWSEFVRSYEILRFGQATKTTETKSVAHHPHDRSLRLQAKSALVRPPMRLTGLQARAVARGFATSVERSGYKIYACSIMPDHAHLVIGRHDYSIERIAHQLKANATAQLKQEKLHPYQNAPYRDGSLPSIWCRKQWSVFLSDAESIIRAIDYANNNPIRAGLKPQAWSFITPYHGQEQCSKFPK